MYQRPGARTGQSAGSDLGIIYIIERVVDAIASPNTPNSASELSAGTNPFRKQSGLNGRDRAHRPDLGREIPAFPDALLNGTKPGP
jgi:hypothetical protein